MTISRFAARFALALSLCLMTVLPAQARSWQCVPYARMMSGINIHGDALTWWKQAKGDYKRGSQPEVGAVMSFAPEGKMRLGHVAMVSKIVSDRVVLLDHANWSHPGGVEHDVKAVDVSAAGDWSEVKVWYAPIGRLGATTYPLNGFIYPDDGPDMVPDGGGALPTTVMADADMMQKGIIAFTD